jgi:hypothetical protein
LLFDCHDVCKAWSRFEREGIDELDVALMVLRFFGKFYTDEQSTS